MTLANAEGGHTPRRLIPEVKAHLSDGRMVVCGDLLAPPVSDRHLGSTRVTALQFGMPCTLATQLKLFSLGWKPMEKYAQKR